MWLSIVPYPSLGRHLDDFAGTQSPARIHNCPHMHIHGMIKEWHLASGLLWALSW